MLPELPPRHIPGTPAAGGNPNTLPQHTGRHTPAATPTARTRTRNTRGTPPAHPWQGKPPARHTPAHPCGRPPTHAANSWHNRSRLEAYPQHTWSTLRHTHSTPLRHTTRKTRRTPDTSPAHPGTPAAHPRSTRGTNTAGGNPNTLPQDSNYRLSQFGTRQDSKRGTRDTHAAHPQHTRRGTPRHSRLEYPP